MYDLGAQSRQDLAQFTSDMGCVMGLVGLQRRRGWSWAVLKRGVMGGSGDLVLGTLWELGCLTASLELLLLPCSLVPSPALQQPFVLRCSAFALIVF